MQQNTNLMNRHPKTSTHKKLMKLLAEDKIQKKNSGGSEEKPHHIITNRHVRSVFIAVKTHQSFEAHVENVKMQQMNFGKETMGTHCMNGHAANSMAMAISEVYRKDLISAIRVSQVLFSIIIDGSTGKCFLMVAF